MRVLPFIALAFSILISIPAAAQAPLSRTEYVLWTTCTVTLYDHATPATLQAIFERLHEIDARLSTNTPGSELDAVNAAAGREAVHVTDDVFEVIGKALELSKLSEGLFDPTVGPLMAVWSMNSARARVPEPADITAARSLVDWREVVADPVAKTLYLPRPGMKLDAGGVEKGYAADEVVRILASHGVQSSIIDLGGDIFAMGSKPGGSLWEVGIQNPDAERGTPLGSVAVRNKSVVTSGVYEHFFEQNGKRYHHIMDTRTGFPVDNGLTSVTVVADTSIDADGIALSVFCLGPVRGLALAKSLAVDAVIVDSAHRIYATEGARRIFSLTNTGFTFAPQ
jgi:FAD:protein FMN transferase